MFGSMPAALMKSYLPQLLNGYLKEESFRSLSANLWRGSVVVENAHLKEDLLDPLGLPVTLRDGTVGRLEVTVPWSSLTTSSTMVQVVAGWLAVVRMYKVK